MVIGLEVVDGGGWLGEVCECGWWCVWEVFRGGLRMCLVEGRGGVFWRWL